MLTKETAAPRAEPISGIRTAAPVLAFFMGGCMVLLLLFLYEVYKWQKYRY